MATPVVSLPVPAVVGTIVNKSNYLIAFSLNKNLPHSNGFKDLVIESPFPIGALTKSKKSLSG